MEILILLFFIAGPFLHIGGILLSDPQIAGRFKKVARASVEDKLGRRNQLIPGIVPTGVVALEPRNKDWGPDGRLTQMWDDAFKYWQLEDPAGTLESYRIKHLDWEQQCGALRQKAKQGRELYEIMIGGRGMGYIESAVKAKMQAEDAEDDLRWLADGPRDLTPEEQVVAGLAERYGTEVYYNNDLVRLSSQKQMPTFDYIALTSV